MNEIGRLTLRTFNKMYQCYKNNFDLEMLLEKNGMTYQDYENKQIESEEWF